MFRLSCVCHAVAVDVDRLYLQKSNRTGVGKNLNMPEETLLKENKEDNLKW